MLAGQKCSKEQKARFFELLDRDGSVRADSIDASRRVGVAGDNAAMASFFSLLEKNAVDRRRWDTREGLRIAIVTWIERIYHRRRR